MSEIKNSVSQSDESLPVDDIDKQFDVLCQQFYKVWFRFHPETAVAVGIYDYAGQLKSYEHDDIGALLVLNQKMLSALDELSVSKLSDARQIDYRLLRGSITIELHDLEDNDWRYRNPLDYLPVNAIYQLIIHPGDNVHQAIKHRLELIPGYLRGARVMLSRFPERIVPEWAVSAKEISVAGAGFIRGMARHPLVLAKFSNPARLQPLLDEAATALTDFAAYLEAEAIPSAKGRFASGVNRFNRLLKEKHFLEVDTDSLLRFAESLLQSTEEQLLQSSVKICGEADFNKALDKVRLNYSVKHLDASALLDRYRQQMQMVHSWLLASDVVTVPEKQSLKVQQTPVFMREIIPFAAYEPPMVSDEEQRGFYYVTTVDDESSLAEHNQYSIDLTSVHEAFPGHHLQFVIANQVNKNNVTRLLHTSASMYEGWALYCEQLVFEQGLFNKNEHQFILLRDRLWRALRIVIDVKLHTGQFSFDDAVNLLVQKLGFDPLQAKAEISWYSSAAATPLCYAVGREIILKTRQIVMASGDNTVSDKQKLKQFHDALLSQGSIALPLVIQSVFGEAVWQQVFDEIFV